MQRLLESQTLSLNDTKRNVLSKRGTRRILVRKMIFLDSGGVWVLNAREVWSAVFHGPLRWELKQQFPGKDQATQHHH